MSKIYNLDAELKAARINKENLCWESYLSELGIKYIGQQERLNDFSLDTFNDLVTGSTHLRGQFESVEDMVRRIRRRKG